MLDHSAVAVPLKVSSMYTTTPTTSTVTDTTDTGGLAVMEPPNRDDARRLFMGNLPKAKTEVEICSEVSRNTEGLVRVITYKNFENPLLHRGFCFLDYESSKAAAEAKRRLSRCTVFGCKTIVDWADPEPEADAQKMATVRILFVRQYGGMLDERTLAEVFGQYGTVERVKNLKNYAFVHFERRSDAQDAMNALDGAVDEASGVRLDVSWAKPPAEKHIRERVLRDRERRIRLQAHGTHFSDHEAVPVVRFNDKTFEATASTSALNNYATPTSVSAVPYSNYDHFEYDFDRQTFACTCQVKQNVETEPLQRQPKQQRRQQEQQLRKPEQQLRQPEQQQKQPKQRQRCRCIAGVTTSAADSSSVDSGGHRADSDDDSGRTQWQQQRIPHQPQDTDETTAHFAGTSTARHDHGDCAINISDLDSIILNFFHKKSHTT